MSAFGSIASFWPAQAMSAIPPIATIKRTFPDVRYVPIADIGALIRSPHRRGRERRRLERQSEPEERERMSLKATSP